MASGLVTHNVTTSAGVTFEVVSWAPDMTAPNTGVVPVVMVIGAQATWVDKSSSIATGGASQVLMAANTSRRGFRIQNLSAGDLWYNDLGAASAAAPSIWLPPGAIDEVTNAVTTAQLTIWGATTGQTFSAREMVV